MPTFNYKAKDTGGNTVTGTVDADTPSQAAGKIREMGRLPMDIKAIGFAAAAGQSGEAGSVFARYFVYPIWTGVNLRGLVFFYRQMATLLAAGMSLSEALRSVRRRSRGRLGSIIDEMCDTTNRGGRLSDVVSRHPKVFGSLQLSLIRVGETGGLLAEMVDRIASYLEYEMRIRQRIIMAVFYPCAIVAFYFVWLVVMAFINGGRPEAIAAAVGLFTGVFVPLVCLIVILKLIMQFRPMRAIWDTIKIAPPWIGTAARKIAMSRFSRAFALLYASGIPMSEGLAVAAEASGNVALAGRIKMAVPALQSGEGLTSALTRTGALMSMVVDMLATGEKTGGMDAVLQKVSDYMDDEVDVTLHKLAIMLFILPIIALGVLVAMQAVSFYGGYFNKLLGSGGGG